MVEAHIDENWYAFYTKPHSEKKTHARLEAAGFISFLPLVESVRIWSDRKKKIAVPLISSFVFVKIEERKLVDVLKTQGVIGVLKYLKSPAKIKESEINNLKIITSNSDQVHLFTGDSFIQGDLVEVVKGPFMGLYAQCILLQGKHRVIVSVQGVDNIFEVNVPLSFLQKLKSV